MPQVIYDPGTGTIIGLADCVVIEVPEGFDLEQTEEFCESNLQVRKAMFQMDYCDGTPIVKCDLSDPC